jgi:hypothetical protein
LNLHKGIITLTLIVIGLRRQSKQFDQLKQLRHAKYGTALRDSQEWICLIGIRPGQWNSACLAVIVLEVNELATPALAITEQLKLTLIERVKRVRNREVLLQLVHIGCSYTRMLSAVKSAASVRADHFSPDKVLTMSGVHIRGVCSWLRNTF